MKKKMVDGGECRKCGEIGLIRKKTKNHKIGAYYHFGEYLLCLKCRQMYMDNDTRINKN